MAWDGRALSYALRTRVDRVRIPLISDMGPGKAETLEVLGDIAKPSLENCGHLDVHIRLLRYALAVKYGQLVEARPQ